MHDQPGKKRMLVVLLTLVSVLQLQSCAGEREQANTISETAEDGLVYHFGYGSNLSSRFLRQYCPNLKYVMKAALPNYRVEFRYYSENMQGGISSIMEAPGEMTHGVIYSIPAAEMDALDIIESVPEGLYTRETFLVLGEDNQWHKADLYRVAVPEGPFTPAKEYLDLMIEGAREHGLDPEYTEQLQAMRNALN